MEYWCQSFVAGFDWLVFSVIRSLYGPLISPLTEFTGAECLYAIWQELDTLIVYQILDYEMSTL